MKAKLKQIRIGKGILSIEINTKFKKYALSKIEEEFKSNEAYVGCGLTLDKNIRINFKILDFVRDIEPYLERSI